MKRTMIIVACFGVILVGLTCGFACLSKRVAPTPEITCPSEVNLGEQELGSLALGRFEISNTGSLPLVIENVSTNCSCTGLEEEEDGVFTRVSRLVIPPKSTVPLVIRVSVRGFPIGSTGITSVFFETNDPNAPNVEIQAIVNEVKGGVYVLPDSVVFGTVVAGSEESKIVQVFDDSVTPRVLDSVLVSGSPYVRAELRPPHTEVSAPIRKDRKHIADIVVSVKSDNPADLESLIAISLKGEHRKPDSIRVIGRVQPDLDVFPSAIRLPLRSTSGDIYDIECICRSPSSRDFELTLEASSPLIVVERLGDSMKGSEHRIRVVADPDKNMAKEVGGSITLRATFDDGHESKVVIPVTVK